MSQVIKIKRGGISGISGASTVKGELIIATGSLGNNASGPFLLAHGDSLGLVAGAVFTGSSVPTITDSELNGILFYDSANSRFMRLDSSGNQALNIAATGFTGDTDDVAEGSTNLYYTDVRVKTKLTAEAVVSGSGNVLNATNVKANLPSGTVSGSAQISGITNTQLAGSIANDKLANDGITIAGADTSLGGTITAATILGAGTTANLPENTNLYYTDARVKTKLTAEAVVSGSATNVRTFLNVADGATNYGDTEVKTKLTAEAVVSGSGNVLNATNVAANLPSGTVSGSSQVSHDNTTGFVANEHIDHSGVSITAGDGLTGGGTIAATRTIAVGAGTGVTVNANDIAIGQDVATTADVTFASASLANLTVTGNASIQGTLTTVNSNDVNIGDRIITLNTADGAGDAGVHVHDTTGAQTGSIMWDASGNYWKGGLKDSEKRIVTFNADNPTDDAFIHTNGSDEIIAIAAVAGGILQRNADNNAFTVSNTIDGGSY